MGGKSEDLEIELKKWFKNLSEKRLELTNPVKASLQQVVDDEKKIDAYLDKVFADNKAKRDAAEAERKKTKKAEVMSIMADMLNAVDLPPEYLSKVVFREEYYQKTMVNKKLRDSIQEQIDTQVDLYKGWLAQQELLQQKMKNREMQINMLNQQYGVNGTYSMFPIETFTDEQVAAKYEANHQRKLEQARLEQEQAEKVRIEKELQDVKKNEVQTEAQDVQDNRPPHRLDICQNHVPHVEKMEESIQTKRNEQNQATPPNEVVALEKVLTITLSTGEPAQDIKVFEALMRFIDVKLVDLTKQAKERQLVLVHKVEVK